MILIVAIIAMTGLLLGVLSYFKIVDWRIAIGATALLFAINLSSAALNFHSQVADEEVLNGEVTSKDFWKFSCPTNTWNPCRNGYSCHCHQVCTGSGKNRSCHQECDTCYVYPWEKNWYVQSNIFGGRGVEINRIDAQGAGEPPRWSLVQKGDPTSAIHDYINWVKGAANSLFHQKPENYDEYVSKVPQYPIAVRDYYKVDRVFSVDTQVDATAWNLALANTLRDLGPKKQINVIVFFYNGLSDTFPEVVRHQWRGFKKNDAVIFMGLSGNLVTDVNVMSWSDKDMFNVVLRDELHEAFLNKEPNDIDISQFMSIMHGTVLKEYVRRSMASYEYLKAEIGYTAVVWWILSISIFIVLAASLFITYKFKDDFSPNTNYYRR